MNYASLFAALCSKKKDFKLMQNRFKQAFMRLLLFRLNRN